MYFTIEEKRNKSKLFRLETVKIRKILPLSCKNTGECGLRCYFYRSGCESESICQKKMKI
jgi:hypothetical protein